ncbi:hypothetical protein HY333_01590 [Candidatus Collierbacteria bacterium]|nr:hypothetical protein [Candidatus Collierbacteria bacterium]
MQPLKIFFLSLLALFLSASDLYAQVVGNIPAPANIPDRLSATGSFLSVIIKFFVVIAGLFSFWQFLTGGFTYITSAGDKAKVQEATAKINMALLGLVVITASFILTAIISKLLFGDFGAILNPTLETISDPKVLPKTISK